MKISVLIPTYNRKEWLLKTLGCVNIQVYRNFEVIIVDASACEDQMLDSDITSLGFPINYVRYGVAGNVSRQRNLALSKATGDILLFIDDDVEFDENFFLNYVKLFEGGNYAAISGLVETEKYRRGSSPFRSSGNILLDLGRDNYQPCDFEVRTYVICTANFAFLKTVYELVGGFDEKIYGVFDDVDYGFKLESHGIDVVHHPLVSLFHFQVRATGARSSSLPGWWAYYNICYFQLKNNKTNKLEFFLLSSWQILRPSRTLLFPSKLIRSYSNFLIGFRKASKNVVLNNKK